MINKVLFIGDPHFKVSNALQTDIFCSKCIEIFEQNKDAICVIGGDILDTHEKLHQTPYNKALKFIDALRKINKIILLVGNHDYENNQQFLTDKHWMNSLKYWENVTVVDSVKIIDDMVFVPYVPPGKFIDALDTIDYDWKNAKCIFAHQEFRGCNFGIIKSENGDKWPLDYPLVISGHIHKPHSPQKNIIYPGSVIQHNFGEEENDTGINIYDFSEPELKIKKIKVDIPSLITLKIQIEDLEKTVKSLNVKPLQKIRIFCTGTIDQCKSMKKRKFYKEELPVGVTVIFNYENKSNSLDLIDDDSEFQNFESALKSLIETDDSIKSVFTALTNTQKFSDIFDSFSEMINKELEENKD